MIIKESNLYDFYCKGLKRYVNFNNFVHNIVNFANFMYIVTLYKQLQIFLLLNLLAFATKLDTKATGEEISQTFRQLKIKKGNSLNSHLRSRETPAYTFQPTVIMFLWSLV